MMTPAQTANALATSFFASKASYYDESKRKWHEGELFICLNCFIFTSDDFPPLKLDFPDCTLIKKANSTFIYQCIVICIKKTNHWFSPCGNRDYMINLCEHFWRESLFTNKNKTSFNPNVSDKSVPGAHDLDSTSLGSDMLKLAHDSQDTLADAAVTLSDQGAQLDHALHTSKMIESDLGISARLLKRLQSPYTALVKGVSPGNKSENKNCLAQNEGYNIMFSEGHNQSNVLKKGSLLIKDQFISILDANGTLVFRFVKYHVSSIEILSPWNFTICKQCVGEKNIVYRIVCARLAEFLNIFKKSFPDCLRFHKDEDIDLLHLKTRRIQKSFQTNKDSSLRENLRTSQVQAQKSSQVSDAEADEISKAIYNMKKMAVAIGKEQNHQNDLINNLITSVDNSNAHMSEQVKKMNKLM